MAKRKKKKQSTKAVRAGTKKAELAGTMRAVQNWKGWREGLLPEIHINPTRTDYKVLTKALGRAGNSREKIVFETAYMSKLDSLLEGKGAWLGMDID